MGVGSEGMASGLRLRPATPAREVAYLETSAGHVWGFASREDLFPALLGRHIDLRIKEIERVVESDAPIEQQLNEAARGFIDFVGEDSAWALLFTEFWAYAVPIRSSGRA